MNADPRHEEIESLLAAYALDAVDPDEGQLVERHVEHCPRCRAELDAHRLTAGALGNAVEPLPPQLWDRIASQLRATPGAGGPTAPLTLLEGPPGEVPTTPVEGHSESSGPRRAHRRGMLSWAVAAVAVAAIVAVAVLAVNLSQSNSRVRQLQVARTAAPTAAVAAALRTPGHTVVDLRTSGGENIARIVLVPDGRGYVVGTRLPAVAPDQTYQLWAQRNHRFISVGVLGARPRVGGGFLVGPTPPSALAVTVEPAGGVTAPDRTPVAEGAPTRA